MIAVGREDGDNLVRRLYGHGHGHGHGHGDKPPHSTTASARKRWAQATGTISSSRASTTGVPVLASRTIIMSDTIAKLDGPNVHFARSATQDKRGELLVIHAMELRDKYRKRYEDRR